MKKSLTMLMMALVSLLSATISYGQASTDFAGKLLSVGDNVTSLQTGKWYFIYNASTNRFIKEGSGNKLTTTTTSPNGQDAEANRGYLVQLEAAEQEGQYYLKTGMGNYFCNFTTKVNYGTSATTEAKYVYAISAFNDNAGHWLLQSNPNNANGLKYYLQSTASLIASNTTGSLNGDRDWQLCEATLGKATDLKGKEYVQYVLNKGGLIRLTNRRKTGYSLADNGEKTVGQVNNKNTLQQVWVLEKSGSAYTLKNAETGRYLNDDDNFRSPSNSANNLYIQYSPNNSGTSSWINISEDSKFSGNVCLNLNGDSPTTLYKWACSGDAGSDWTISIVENYTIDQVRDHLAGSSGYAAEVSESAYYRLVCTTYGRVITENTADNSISGESPDDSKINQLWRFVKTGTTYQIKNALTDRFIQRQNGSLSSTYKTTTSNTSNTTAFTLKRTDDAWNNTWTITDASSVGLHCASSQSYNIVGWYTSAEASIWAFERVDITAEEIEEARGGLSAFKDLQANVPNLQKALNNLFTDKACTTLKSEIQGLSDEELTQNADYASLNADMQAMVLKVKNNTWAIATDATTNYSTSYDKFFRVADYRVYSNYQKMSWNEYCGQSNAYGKLSNPTGIVANAGDILYIYVDQDPKSDCTLQIEACPTSGVPGEHQTGATQNLQAGLNVIRYADQQQLYIFYQLNDPEKYLADYPDIRIHIEGGQLNGYWDATRGMTNQDWKLMQEAGLLHASPVLNLKTKHLVFAMQTDGVINAVKRSHTQAKDAEEDIEKLMRIWDMIPTNEESYQGLEGLEGRYNNIWNCFSVNYNYMFATTYGTYYHEDTLPSVMNYYSMTHQSDGNEGGSMWGPSHEMGHNHQAAICLIGTMEASNNLFSNINQFEQGVSTTRYKSPVGNFADFNAGKCWNARDITVSTRMFFQLYLYFHALHNDDTFYPRLFQAMRKDPINKQGDGWDNSLVSGENSGGYRSYGRQDYLKFAKKVCDIAQADLSEFFEAYGMFVPEDNVFVGDYANYFVTTTQKDIDDAKAYMQKYPKKLGNIMFIDDHIATKQAADANNKFEAVPASSGLKVNCCTYDGSKMGTAGETGFYEDFLKEPTNRQFTYTQKMSSPYTVTVMGEGAIGYKVYDTEGKLVLLSNSHTFSMSYDLRKAGFTVKVALSNGEDVDAPKYNASAIQDILSDETENGKQEIFDLQGRRLKNIHRAGLYIINGQKTLVR